MTSVFVGNDDDSSKSVSDIGFSFPFYANTYRLNLYVASNSFITLGYSSAAYGGFSYSSPGRGIFLDPGDRSLQILYMKQDISGQTCRIRFEGSLTSVMASPRNLIWEATFFAEGAIMISSGQAMTNCYVTDGTGSNYTNFTVDANSSGVLVPSGAGYSFRAGSYG